MKMHVFPYSERKGTVAAARTDQVAMAERKRRAQELIAVGEASNQDWLKRQAGRQERLLIEFRQEGPDGQLLLRGYDDHYQMGELSLSPSQAKASYQAGEWLRVRHTGQATEQALAKLELDLTADAL